jgi:hypothetical protein
MTTIFADKEYSYTAYRVRIDLMNQNTEISNSDSNWLKEYVEGVNELRNGDGDKLLLGVSASSNITVSKSIFVIDFMFKTRSDFNYYIKNYFGDILACVKETYDIQGKIDASFQYKTAAFCGEEDISSDNKKKIQ